MKNGSESVVPVRAGLVRKTAEFPNKPAIPSLVSRWQRKTLSLADEILRAIASAVHASFGAQQPVMIKVVSKTYPAPHRNAGSKRYND